MNYFDLTSTLIVLLALYLIPRNRKYWILYSFGCFLWIILHFTKQLYFGMFMNLVALIIGIKNWKSV